MYCGCWSIYLDWNTISLNIDVEACLICNSRVMHARAKIENVDFIADDARWRLPGCAGLWKNDEVNF